MYVHVYTKYDRQVVQTKTMSTDALVFVFYTDIQCTVYPISSPGLIYFYTYIIDLLSGTVSI